MILGGYQKRYRIDNGTITKTISSRYCTNNGWIIKIISSRIRTMFNQYNIGPIKCRQANLDHFLYLSDMESIQHRYRLDIHTCADWVVTTTTYAHQFCLLIPRINDNITIVDGSSRIFWMYMDCSCTTQFNIFAFPLYQSEIVCTLHKCLSERQKIQYKATYISEINEWI